VELNPDFSALLSEFNAHEVRYLIVGGYAFAFHARPRYTKDIDIWIDAELENARRAWRALAKFGAPLGGVSAEDLATLGTVFQIGVAPNRIDILNRVEGLEFADAWPHRVTTNYGDVAVAVLGRDELIANKRAVGRLQDLADLEVLERRPRRRS